jgi:hypothetical protein
VTETEVEFEIVSAKSAILSPSSIVSEEGINQSISCVSALFVSSHHHRTISPIRKFITTHCSTMGKKSRNPTKKNGKSPKSVSQLVQVDPAIFGPVPSTATVQEFWRWFLEHEAELFQLHPARDTNTLNRMLVPQLAKVNDDLTYEFGSDQAANSIRELVISANGYKRAFAAVKALDQAAPRTAPNVVNRWRIVAFRSRTTSKESLETDRGSIMAFEGKQYSSNFIRYALMPDSRQEKIGIMLFMKGYTKEDEHFFGNVGYLFLDHILGEYDVEMHVGAVMFNSHEVREFAFGAPLSELTKEFDFRLADKLGPKPQEGWVALTSS